MMAATSFTTRSTTPSNGGGPSSPRQQQQQQNHHHQQQQQQQHSLNSRSETALAWYRRCQQKRIQERRLVDAPPTDPASAAWAFFRSSTGIPFVDESLRRCCHRQTTNRLPALEIRDDGTHTYNGTSSGGSSGGTGKTRTLLSLAARFVVSTRPSLFTASQEKAHSTIEHNENVPQPTITTTTTTTETTPQSEPPLPRVILLDSTMDVTPLKLAYAVSSLLLREQQCDEHTASSSAALEQDIQDCLSRIHIAHTDSSSDISGWVPVLESLRCELLLEQRARNNNNTTIGEDDDDHHQPQEESCFPTLLLWDGFLSETSDAGSRMEVTRQLARLLKDCPVGLIYTTSSTSWSHHFNVRSLEVQERDPGQHGTLPANRGYCNSVGPIAQTVRLQRDESEGRRHDFVAIVSPGNNQIVYSLSAAGVLR